MREKIKQRIEADLHDLVHDVVIDLSNEQLTVEDYHWLAGLINHASFLKKIKLPEITSRDCEEILSILTAVTTKNSTLESMEIVIPADLFENHEKINAMSEQIKSRLTRNRKKIFGIHGGGNIGLGLMADVISRSAVKYDIVATSSNMMLRNLVNSVSRLWLQHGKSFDSRMTCVENVRMISRDSEDINSLYMDSCIVAICLTPSVFPQVVKDIAEALISRYQHDGSGLKILVLMNLPDCAVFVRKKIADEISALIDDQQLVDVMLSGIEFIPTVIDRIVSPIEPVAIQDQLRSQLIGKKVIPSGIDGELYIHEMMSNPERLMNIVSLYGLKVNLFNAEKNFSIYVPDDFPEAHQFPLMRRSNNLNQLETIKNKFINGPHAILAWTGALFGYKKITDALKDHYIFNQIQRVMEFEVKPALLAEYPDLTDDGLALLKNDFIERCLSNIDDTVERVGRDPLRKLDAGGRIRGTIELVKKHKLDIPLTGLEQGIAAGVLYAVKQLDPDNPGCQKIIDIYNAGSYSYKHVLCYHGDAPSGSFTGLDPHEDKELLRNILNRINAYNARQVREDASKQNQLSTVHVMKKFNPRLSQSRRVDLLNMDIQDKSTVENDTAEKKTPKSKGKIIVRRHGSTSSGVIFRFHSKPICFNKPHSISSDELSGRAKQSTIKHHK